MRVRAPFAASFAALVVFAGYVGLAKINIPSWHPQSDKVLHFICFFLFTILFYWTFETSRRRAIQLTLLVVTVLLATGSEILQGALPNNRDFDYFDILANVVGSLAALGICSAYHRRMLERKRAAKGFATVSDEECGDVGPDDLELEEEVTALQEIAIVGTAQEADIDDELEQWDENVGDNWDEEDPVLPANGKSKLDV